MAKKEKKKVNDIPLFSGEHIMKWMEIFYRVANEEIWNEKQRLDVLYSHWSGQAKYWVERRRSQFQNERVCEIFRAFAQCCSWDERNDVVTFLEKEERDAAVDEMQELLQSVRDKYDDESSIDVDEFMENYEDEINTIIVFPEQASWRSCLKRMQVDVKRMEKEFQKIETERNLKRETQRKKIEEQVRLGRLEQQLKEKEEKKRRKRKRRKRRKRKKRKRKRKRRKRKKRKRKRRKRKKRKRKR